jgi:hypothetical protein
MKPDGVVTGDWWSHRRLRYNVVLVVAGIVAYAVVLETRCLPAADVEITLFTTAFQAIGYLIAMAIANVFYNLGRWMEAVLRPDNVAAYRKWAWGLGVGLSVALPFTIPVAVAITRCRPV